MSDVKEEERNGKPAGALTAPLGAAYELSFSANERSFSANERSFCAVDGGCRLSRGSGPPTIQGL